MNIDPNHTFELIYSPLCIALWLSSDALDIVIKNKPRRWSFWLYTTSAVANLLVFVVRLVLWLVG